MVNGANGPLTLYVIELVDLAPKDELGNVMILLPLEVVAIVLAIGKRPNPAIHFFVQVNYF